MALLRWSPPIYIESCRHPRTEALAAVIQVAAARGLLARLPLFHVSNFEFEMVSKVADVFIANFSYLRQTIK